jgi:hypothetical protein
METCSAEEIHGHLETEQLHLRLRDRGVGIPLSMFGTYIQEGQLILYPFFEYYRDSNYEYAPNELGFSEDHDYRGEYVASEALFFAGYGVSERLALELEVAVIDAKLEKSSEDLSGVPEVIEESGLGDVESQIRWRWSAETPTRPEFFSYFETVFPTQDQGSLIGTSDWEFKLGAGLTRGYSFGTMSLRAAVEYDNAEAAAEIGEMAIEYLRRLSSSWRVFTAVEGTQDEIELIAEGQWHVSKSVFLKLNNAVGLTSKATDWAPEVGIVFSL